MIDKTLKRDPEHLRRRFNRSPYMVDAGFLCAPPWNWPLRL